MKTYLNKNSNENKRQLDVKPQNRKVNKVMPFVDNRQYTPLIIQKMDEIQMKKLWERWELIEKGLDKMYFIDKTATFPIVPELETIRETLNSDLQNSNFSTVSKMMADIEHWMKSSPDKRALGITLKAAPPIRQVPVPTGGGGSTLESGDFFLTGIAVSALDRKIPKGAEHEVIASFEEAVKRSEINWRAFQGQTHNTITTSLGTFKAHFQDGGIKLYIDSYQGKGSVLRAEYRLKGKQLDFVRFSSH